MAEEKNEIRTITPAKVEQRSVVKDLAKYAMDEYIKPKTNDVLHDLFSGVVDMFGDAIRGAIDKQFYGEDRSRNRIKGNKVQTFNQNVPYNVYSLSPSYFLGGYFILKKPIFSTKISIPIFKLSYPLLFICLSSIVIYLS